MKLSKTAQRVLGTLLGQADRLVSEMIRERGGNAANVRETGHWANRRLGEVAMAVALGDRSALKAMKIVKRAQHYGRRY
jgi:hypothetical protein